MLHRHVQVFALLGTLIAPLPLILAQTLPGPTAESEENLPIAEWPGVVGTAAKDPGQGLRNRWVLPGSAIQPTDVKGLIIDEDQGEPLPVTHSDSVVTGQILAAEAKITNDRRSLYSQFNLEVEDVHYSNGGVERDSVLVLVRAGGAVRLPSGRIYRREVLHKQMPVVGNRYLLFLRHDVSSETFYVLGGYRLMDGLVRPLDTRSHLQPFSGLTENDLLDRLRSALQQNAGRGKGRD